jgi:hypothetical protein
MVERSRVQTVAARLLPGSVSRGRKARLRLQPELSRQSNEQPPPYHGTSQATGRNPRQRFPPDRAVSAPSRLPPLATGCNRSAPQNAPSSVVRCGYDAYPMANAPARQVPAAADVAACSVVVATLFRAVSRPLDFAKRSSCLSRGRLATLRAGVAQRPKTV